MSAERPIILDPARGRVAAGAPHAARPRRAGVLLHPTSLPGRFGVGDLGPVAISFLDWARSAGLTLWQILPLGPPGYANSPYDAASALAGNPQLISPERLVEDGLIEAEALAAVPVELAAAAERADFAAAAAWKTALLRDAHRRLAAAPAALRQEFEAFRREERDWLADWSLFSALKERHGRVSWSEWPIEIRHRVAEAVAAARAELAAEIEFAEFQQFLFFRQWRALRAAAAERGISLLGDVPIYVAGDSADVWAHQDLFLLDAQSRPTVVAGVPPDYFSAEGQLWGNPLYDWREHERTGFRWWIDRVRMGLRFADFLRLDHFRGFAAYWEVPAGAPNAVSGRWRPAPGARLLKALGSALGGLPFVAEDLGVITDDVTALRQRFRLPGMRVLLFAFDDLEGPHAPHHHAAENVVYTGTHDNDTAEGWFAAADLETRRTAVEYLGLGPETISWKLVRAAFESVAEWAIVPMQDFLGLGSSARMNRPSVARGNWTWRLLPDQVPADLARRLRRLGALTARIPASGDPGGAPAAATATVAPGSPRIGID